jgi:hypothetical protein
MDPPPCILAAPYWRGLLQGSGWCDLELSFSNMTDHNKSEMKYFTAEIFQRKVAFSAK